MRYCKQCGKPIENGTKFCGFCGTEITEDPLENRIDHTDDEITEDTPEKHIPITDDRDLEELPPEGDSGDMEDDENMPSTKVIIAVVIIAVLLIAFLIFTNKAGDESVMADTTNTTDATVVNGTNGAAPIDGDAEAADVMTKVDTYIQSEIFNEDYDSLTLDERRELAESKLIELASQGLIKQDSIVYSDGTFTFVYANGALGSVVIKDWGATQNTAEENKVIDTDIQTIAEAYTSNPVKAKEDYTDKLIRVSGIVEKIDSYLGDSVAKVKLTTVSDGAEANLIDKLTSHTASCMFTGENVAAIANINIGDTVTITGECKGILLGTLNISDCTLN